MTQTFHNSNQSKVIYLSFFLFPLAVSPNYFIPFLPAFVIVRMSFLDISLLHNVIQKPMEEIIGRIIRVHRTERIFSH